MNELSIEDPFDVIIVGARVAGSIAAASLAERGHSVLLVDRARLPSPTLSTHFFRGAGLVSVLDRLGVLDEGLALGAPKLTRQWSSVNGGELAESPPQSPGDAGFCLSVRREPLDSILLRRATTTGAVQLADRAKVVACTVAADRVEVTIEHGGALREVTGRLLVGADGRRSFVARAVNAPTEHREAGHRALYYGYVEGWTAPNGSAVLDAAEFSFRDDEVAYVFPSDGGQTCVAVSVNAATFEWMKGDLEDRFRARLSEHAAFRSRLGGSSFTTRIVGAGKEANVIRQASGDGWALVGDAGQHQDPWTGAGMDLAGTKAIALAAHYGDWLQGKTQAGEAAANYADARNAIGTESWWNTVVGSRHIAAG